MTGKHVKENMIRTPRLQQAVAAFRQLRDVEISKSSTSVPVVDEEMRDRKFVNFSVTMKKMSGCQKILMIPFTYPHTLLRPDGEVCLIIGCKDGDKNNMRADHDRWAFEYKQKLRSLGISRDIHVLPIMQLETEYKSYEAKRKLCKAFDHFLCDHRILFKMPQLLGCTFFKKGRMPIRVYLKDETKIKHEIESALDRSIIQITPDGSNFSTKLGNLADHSDTEITENIRAFLDTFIPEHFPGGNDNVNSLHLASFDGKAIPVYLSLTSANEVDMTEVDAKFDEKQRPVEIADDEVDTMMGVRVKVRSDGKVSVVRNKGAGGEDDGAVEDEESVENVLDEDYLDVFREQEMELREEATKRYHKHLARKAALRKVGRKFGPNMLKLPNQHVPVPKPRFSKAKRMPKQDRPVPPAVPVRDALQGFDEEEERSIQVDTTVKKLKPKKLKADSSLIVSEVAESAEESFVGTSSAKKALKLKKKSKLGKGDRSTSDNDNVRSPIKDKNTTPRNVNISSAKKATRTPDVPRPILKTPRESELKQKRKSVTFDFTPPVYDKQLLKTPEDTEPTPIYSKTPSPGSKTGAGKKRKSMLSGFDITPGIGKKARQSRA